MTNIILKLHFINKILIYWYFYRKCSFKKFVSYGSPFCRTNRLLLLDKYNSMQKLQTTIVFVCFPFPSRWFLKKFTFTKNKFYSNSKMGERYNIHSQLEHLQSKYIGTGHADTTKYEWMTNQVIFKLQQCLQN